jgi:hypothetical protein
MPRVEFSWESLKIDGMISILNQIKNAWSPNMNKK